MTQATKRPREDTDNPVIVVNTPDEIATSSKANNISYNTHQKEKVAFKLNYLNNKKSKVWVSLRIHNTLPERKDNSRQFKSLFGNINQ